MVQRSGRTIEREMFIASPPERVFAAFTQPAELRRWFVTDATIDPRPGGYWHFYFGDEDVDGTIVEIDPPRLLVMDWFEGADKGYTRLTVEFIPQDGGTLLRLVDTGYGSGGDWDALYDGVSSGWTTALGQLRDWVVDGREKVARTSTPPQLTSESE